MSSRVWRVCGLARAPQPSAARTAQPDGDRDANEDNAHVGPFGTHPPRQDLRSTGTCRAAFPAAGRDAEPPVPFPGRGGERAARPGPGSMLGARTSRRRNTPAGRRHWVVGARRPSAQLTEKRSHHRDFLRDFRSSLAVATKPKSPRLSSDFTARPRITRPLPTRRAPSPSASCFAHNAPAPKCHILLMRAGRTRGNSLLLAVHQNACFSPFKS